MPNSHPQTPTPPADPVVLPYRPPVIVTGTTFEVQDFEFISTDSLPEMLDQSESDLWSSVILQYSHKFPAVRESLVALSCISEVIKRKGNPHSQMAPERLDLEFAERNALQLYNKAVKDLVDYLACPNHDLKVVLVSCLIFAWIEVLQNNREAAMKHLTCGLNIIQSLHPIDPTISDEKLVHTELFPGNPDDIYGSMHRSFMRLKHKTGMDMGRNLSAGIVYQ